MAYDNNLSPMEQLITKDWALDEKVGASGVNSTLEQTAFDTWFTRAVYPMLNDFYRKNYGRSAYWSLPAEETRKNIQEAIWATFLLIPVLVYYQLSYGGIVICVVTIYLCVKFSIWMERLIMRLLGIDFHVIRMLPLVVFSEPNEFGFHFAIRNVVAVTDRCIETQNGAQYQWENLMKNKKQFDAFVHVVKYLAIRNTSDVSKIELVNSFCQLMTDVRQEYDLSFKPHTFQ